MIVRKNFGGSDVAFEPFVDQNTVMVNATQMGKVFKKKPVDFLKLDSTQNFISVLERKYGNKIIDPKSTFSFSLNESQGEDLHLDSTIFTSENILKVIHGGQENGTWMHRLLALKFAAWLNAEFELWVYETTEEIMFGYSREQDQSIRRTVLIQHEMKQIEKNLERSGEDFDRYMKLQNQLVIERSIRASGTKQRFRDFYKFFVSTMKSN